MVALGGAGSSVGGLGTGGLVTGGIQETGGTDGSGGMESGGGSDKAKICKAPRISGDVPRSVEDLKPGEFVSAWDVSCKFRSLGWEGGVGTKAEIDLPLVRDGVYDFTVDWGDGTQSVVNSFDDPDKHHDYDARGVYIVRISGKLKGWKPEKICEYDCGGGSDDQAAEACSMCESQCKETCVIDCAECSEQCPDCDRSSCWDCAFDASSFQLRAIYQWGSVELSSLRGCEDLTIFAADAPKLGTSTESMFAGCRGLTFAEGAGRWDTSSVTSMEAMFESCKSCSGDFSSWDTSQVVNMGRIFRGSSVFPSVASWDTSSVTSMAGACERGSSCEVLATWDTSSVRNMSDMFAYSKFQTPHTDLSSWNTSNVEDMSGMFRHRSKYEVSQFNGDISAWDTSSVVTMRNMFKGSSLTGDISAWDTSSVIDMRDMFAASRFDGDISAWNTSSVIDMSGMFYNSPFNGDISSWDTSQVKGMTSTFEWTEFQGDLSTWDVSQVTHMRSMFARSDFTGDVSGWGTSSVTDMRSMFEHSQFTGDISGWDTSSVTNMSYMFDDSSFNGDVSAWDIKNVTSMYAMFRNGSLSTTNYDLLLSSWAAQVATQSSVFPVVFWAGDTKHSAAALDARQALVDAGWRIHDGGLAE